MSVSSVILVINSRNRDHTVYSSSDFRVDTNTIQGAVGIELLECQLALGQMDINATNNQILFYIGSETRLVTISEGNYTAAELVSALNTGLSGSGVVASLTAGRITFTHASKSFKIVTTVQNSIHRVIGLGSSQQIIESDGLSMVCPYPVDVKSGFEYVKICAPDLQHDLQDDTPTHLQPGIGLYKTGEGAEYVIRVVRYPPRFFPTPQKLSSLRIRLENPDGTLYQSANNLDNVFVVRVWKLLSPGKRDN